MKMLLVENLFFSVRCFAAQAHFVKISNVKLIVKYDNIAMNATIRVKRKL